MLFQAHADYALACFGDHKELLKTSEDVSLIISSLLGLLDFSRNRINDPCTTIQHLPKVAELIVKTMQRVALLLTSNTVDFDVILPFLSTGSKYVK